MSDFGSVTSFLRDALTGVKPGGKAKPDVAVIPFSRATNLTTANRRIGKQFDSIENNLSRLISASDGENGRGPSRRPVTDMQPNRTGSHSRRHGGGGSDVAIIAAASLAAAAATKSLADEAGKAIGAGYDKLRQSVSAATTWFSDNLATARDSVLTAVGDAKTVITQGARDIFEATKGFVSSGYDSLKGFGTSVLDQIGGAASALKSGASDLFQRLLNKLPTIGGSVDDRDRGSASASYSFWNNVYGAVGGWTSKFLDAVKAGMPSAAAGGAAAAGAATGAAIGGMAPTAGGGGGSLGTGVRAGRPGATPGASGGAAANPYGDLSGVPGGLAPTRPTPGAETAPSQPQEGSGAPSAPAPSAPPAAPAPAPTAPARPSTGIGGAQPPSGGAAPEASPGGGSPSPATPPASSTPAARPSTSSAGSALMGELGGGDAAPPSTPAVQPLHPPGGAAAPLPPMAPITGPSSSKGPPKGVDLDAAIADATSTDTSAKAGFAIAGRENVHTFGSPEGRSLHAYLKKTRDDDIDSSLNGIMIPKGNTFGDKPEIEGKLYINERSSDTTRTTRHELGHVASREMLNDAMANKLDPEFRARVGTLYGKADLFGPSGKYMEEARQRRRDEENGIKLGKPLSRDETELGWHFTRQFTEDHAGDKNKLEGPEDFRVRNMREKLLGEHNSLVDEYSSKVLESKPSADAAVTPSALPEKTESESKSADEPTTSSGGADSAPEKKERSSRMEYLSRDPGTFVYDMGEYA